MSEHTPTPWELDDDGPTVYLYAKVSKTIWLRGSVACLTDFGWDAPHLANAEFILKAVNSHDALVKDMDDAVKLLHDLLGLVPGSGEAAFAFVERHMLGRVGNALTSGASSQAADSSGVKTGGSK